jgi:hypothetical protein
MLGMLQQMEKAERYLPIVKMKNNNCQGDHH